MKKLIISVIILTSLLISVSVLAAWVDPPEGCDPSLTGPECAEVAAPLNVSSTNQTKAGGLYANFFDAATLQNADGSLALQAASGQDIILQNSLSTKSSIRIAPTMTAGEALRIELNPGIVGIGISGNTDKAHLSIQNPSGPGIFINSDAAASLSQPAYGLESFSTNYSAVYGKSIASYGLQGLSENNHGIYGQTKVNPYFGVMGCFGTNATNCGYLGGTDSAGWFKNKIVVEGNVEVHNLSNPFVYKGISLQAPDSNFWCLRVNNTGALFTNSGTCP